MAQHNERADEFEEQVSEILQLRGYEVERNCTVEGAQIDFVARSQDPFNDLEYFVECCSSKKLISIRLLREKSSVLVKQDQRRRLLFVALAGFTRQAKDFAKANEAIYLTTLEELERNLLDLRPYTQWLIRTFEKSEGMFSKGRLFKTYVKLRCVDLHDRESDLTEVVEKWTNDESTGLLFLLGEYGRGKTSFCRHFAYSLCKKLQSKESNRLDPIPILINLSDYRRNQNIEQIITDTLLNRYGVRILSFGHFQRFCSVGRVMLVLDGFDEMSETGNARHVKECFKQVYALSALGTKTIVTCRTNYFASNQEVIDLLDDFSITLADLLGQPNIEGMFSYKGLAKVVEICNLNEEEVFIYLQKRFGSKAQEILIQLKTIHDLSDLSSRPVLLDMICESLPDLLALRRRISSAMLYEHYTKKWTRRDSWRTELPNAVRQKFCEALAWLTHIAQIETLDHALIRDAVAMGFSDEIESQDQLEVFLNDIQLCSFLVRSSVENTFRFAHKSFKEFFVARRLISELLGGRCPSRDNVDEFLVKRKKRDDEKRAKIQETKKLSGEKKNKKKLARKKAKNVLDNEKLHTGLDLGRHTIIGIVGSSGKTTISHLWDTLREFQSIVDFEEEPRHLFQPAVAESFEETIVQRLEGLFRIETDENFLNKLHITPEIATFAIEILISSQTDIHTFLSGLNEELERQAFITLINLGPAQQFFDTYAKRLIPLMLRSEEWWVDQLSPLLAKFGPPLSQEQITTFSRKLKVEVLSRFQFGLIQNEHDYRSAFGSCFSKENVTLFQRILIAYGSEHKNPEKATDFITEDLIIDFIKECTIDENATIIEFLDFADHSAVRIGNAIINEIRSVDDEATKESLTLFLKEISYPGKLMALRSLISSEKIPRIRKMLKALEKDLLDNQSRDLKGKKRHQGKQGHSPT